MNSFYSRSELETLGLKAFGKNVMISRKCSIYGAADIVLGDSVRIDDFCILSGKIVIGNFVHIAAYSALYAGDAGIEICNFANISSRVMIYAISDDYSGDSLTNPMVPEKYKKLHRGTVVVGKHVIIGTGSTVLPGVELKTGSAVGCMSLVKRDLEPWTINAGIPTRMIKERRKNLLELERVFIESIEN